jgi:hypothetical protein
MKKFAFRNRDDDDCRFAGLGGMGVISAAAVARVAQAGDPLLLRLPQSGGRPLAPNHYGPLQFRDP